MNHNSRLHHSPALFSTKSQLQALNSFWHGPSRFNSLMSQSIIRLHTPLSTLSTLIPNSSPSGTLNFSPRLGQLEGGAEMSADLQITLHHVYLMREAIQRWKRERTFSFHCFLHHPTVSLAQPLHKCSKMKFKTLLYELWKWFWGSPHILRSCLWLLFEGIWVNCQYSVETEGSESFCFPAGFNSHNLQKRGLFCLCFFIDYKIAEWFWSNSSY